MLIKNLKECEEFIGREVRVDIHFENKKLEKYKDHVKMFYNCSFDFIDGETTQKVGYLRVETETLIRFDNNKRVIELWKNDKKTFNQYFANDLGNYIFIEIMPIVSLLLQKMQLPVPIPFPFIEPKETNKAKK